MGTVQTGGTEALAARGEYTNVGPLCGSVCISSRLGHSSRPCGRKAKSKAGEISSWTGRGPLECVAPPQRR